MNLLSHLRLPLMYFIIIIASHVHQVNSQAALKIFSPETDEVTGRLKPFGINYQAGSGELVGIVSAQLNRGNAHYFLLDVVTDPNAKIESSWKNIATHSQTDDCAPTTLSEYGSLRRMFCIDHTRGNIYTTQYYNASKPKAGTMFYLRFQFKYTFFIKEYPLAPHINVLVTSVCDTMSQILNIMSASCSDFHKTVFIKGTRQMKAFYQVAVTGITRTVYLTQINVNFAEMPENLVDGDRIQLTISINHVHLPYNLMTTYFTGQMQVVYLEIPQIVENLNLVRIELFTVKNGQQQNVRDEMFTLVMLPSQDYCSSQPSCIPLAKQYQEELAKNSDECPNIDTKSFGPKFGSCSEAPGPSIIKNDYVLQKTGNIYTGIEVIPGAGSPMYATVSYPMIFSLVSVKSDPELTGSVTNIEAPKECTETFTTAPKSFFCLNAVTGRIYTTSAIAGKLDSANVNFELVVRIANTSFYPIRDVSVPIRLSTLDPCLPAVTAYNTLTNCVQYQILKMSSYRNNSYIFDFRTEDYQRIVAIKVPLTSLHTKGTNRLNISAIMEAEINGLNVTRYQSPYRIYFADYIDLYIDTLAPRLGPNLSIKITLMEDDGILKSKNAPQASLMYIKDFSCSDQCLVKFENWKREASKSSQENCKADRLFYSRNFDVCTNVVPSFSEPLKIAQAKLVSNSPLQISNCKYKSPYEYTQWYWKKDGAILKSQGEPRIKRSVKVDALTKLPEYTVNDLVIKHLSLSDQGFFVCGVKGRDGNEYETASVHIVLEDVATSDVKIALSNAFNLDGNTLGLKLNSIIQGVNNSNVLVDFKGVTRGGLSIFSFQISYAGSVEIREKFCSNINQQNLRNGLENEYIVNYVDVLHHNCCVEVTEGDVNFLGSYTFPVTLSGTSRDFNCSYGRIDGEKEALSRECKRLDGFPSWSSLDVLLKKCKAKTATSEKLIELESLTNEDAIVLSKNLSKIVNEGNLTSKFDVQIVTNLLGVVIQKNASSAEVANNVISTVDGVLNTDENILLESDEALKTSSIILTQLDELALNQPATEEATIIQRPNIDFGILKPNSSRPVVIISQQTGKSNDSGYSISQTPNNPKSGSTSDASITLPSEVVSKANNNSIYSYLFKRPSLFLSKNGNFSMQSVVLSASIANVKVEGLSEPVQLTFQSQKSNVTGLVNTCKFYNTTLQNLPNPWSTSGCRTIRKFGSNEVQCVCDHLTNFAILLDVSQTGANPLALQIITWIGCGISLAGLLLTIVTYTIFQKLRRKLPPKILISLSVSLSAVLIIFLVGAERTSPRVGCQTVAALLQYFILSTFCWMAVEALNLYRNFVKVFSGRSSNSRFMIRASIFSWGVPAIITLATALSRPDNLGPASPEHAQFCVVRGIPFYFAILLPVAVVLVGNMIVLVLVLRGIKDGSQLVKDSRAEKNKKLTQARIAFACAILLGMTWVFAMLAIGELRDFFQWMFCIFNSLQGFFIFVFYTLRSSEVRREWQRVLGLNGLEPTSTSGGKSHSKYISVYRLTHSTSILSRAKSRSSEKSLSKENSNDDTLKNNKTKT